MAKQYKAMVLYSWSNVLPWHTKLIQAAGSGLGSNPQGGNLIPLTLLKNCDYFHEATQHKPKFKYLSDSSKSYLESWK